MFSPLIEITPEDNYVHGETTLSEELKFVGTEKFTTKKKIEYIEPHYFETVTTSSQHKLLLIGTDDKKIKAVNTEDLLDEREYIPLSLYTHELDITFRPTILSVSRNGYSSLLLVAGRDDSLNCPVVEFFHIDTWTSLAKLELTELIGSSIVDYSWHPVYYESLVTLCCDTGHLLVVGLNKEEKYAALVYSNWEYGTRSCSWSPKGKQLVIGRSDGSILRLKPVIQGSSYSFEVVAGSEKRFSHPRLRSEHQLVKVRWISRTNLMLAHAVLEGPLGPDTIYTLSPINPAEPYKFWTDLCDESPVSHYHVQMQNFVNYVICSSSASSEVAIIGVPGQGVANPTDIKLWDALIIDEEGMRIELPLDENNRVSSCRGAAAIMSDSKSVIYFHTSSGFMCPYIAVNPDKTLQIPEMQQLEACPLVLPRKMTSSAASKPPARVLSTPFADSTPTIARQTSPTPIPTVTKPSPVKKSSSPAVPKKVVMPINFHDFSGDIKAIKQGLEFNKVYLSLLEETNRYRKQFEEIQDIHKIHFEALEAIKGDIDALDIGMLENLYLIEYIKSRSRGVTRKKSLDPLTLKKVDSMKQKSKVIAEKLKDLNMCVDVSWEDFVRRRNAMSHKDRRLNSLDTIYKALATNQKLITLLKNKASHLIQLPVPVASKSVQAQCEFVARRELEPSQLRSLKEFLASRSTVPVRRPELLTSKTSSRLQSY